MRGGILPLYKPSGISSARILTPLKRVFSGCKVGHTGTLDPFAEGLLVVLIGSATRISHWFLTLDKRYEAVVRLGAETDTLDPEGEVVRRAPVAPFAALQGARTSFLGTIEQYPPVYSALKVGGTPMYRLARAGQAVEPKPRRVRIHALTVQPTERDDEVAMDVHCGSGTYIRSLARDIAARAGSAGYCRRLVRTAVGPFRAAEGRRIEEVVDHARPTDLLVPTLEALTRLPSPAMYPVSPAVAREMRHGKALERLLRDCDDLPLGDVAITTTPDGAQREAVAIIAVEARAEGEAPPRARYRVVFG